MKILGIETSCDETAVALYDAEKGILAHDIYTQAATHAPFGGVVPELASRDHIQKLLPMVKAVLGRANVSLHDIDGIAYTAGPGLIGALLIGSTFGKALGYALNIPTLGVHHMEGHLLAALLEEDAPSYPFLALLVSGGHTLLVKVASLGQYQILGESLDDAAGEAFDKTAKLLGLGYPAGAKLAQLAKKGSPTRFKFPRPLTQKPGLDFSFSGLKTYALNTYTESSKGEQDKADIARAFEEAVTDTLVIKCKRAFKMTGLKHLVIAGGVGANESLRQKMAVMGAELKVRTYFPRFEYCTDNAAMIAYTGYLYLALAGKKDDTLAINVRPRWAMDTLT